MKRLLLRQKLLQLLQKISRSQQRQNHENRKNQKKQRLRRRKNSQSSRINLCVVFLIVLIVELPGILVNRALGLDGSEPTEQVTIVTVFETVTDVISNIIGLGYDSSMTQVETLIADGGYDYDLSMNALVNHAQSSAGYDVAYIMSAYSTSVDQLSASDSDLEAKLSGVSGNMFPVTSVEKENEVITPVTYYTYI